jgi:hypothetical protein
MSMLTSERVRAMTTGHLSVASVRAPDVVRGQERAAMDASPGATWAWWAWILALP